MSNGMEVETETSFEERLAQANTQDQLEELGNDVFQNEAQYRRVAEKMLELASTVEDAMHLWFILDRDTGDLQAFAKAAALASSQADIRDLICKHLEDNPFYFKEELELAFKRSDELPDDPPVPDEED
jgi:hypothetical protein